MYEAFYNLREMPFTISADPRFIWWGKKHRKAMANLQYGLLKTNGYMVLTGDVGTGKTTMLNALIKSLGEQVETAIVNNPILSPVEFFNLISHGYGLPQVINNKTDFLLSLVPFVKRAHSNGKSVLLIIDEAHCLSEDLLDEIRLLSNIEEEGHKLLSVFFVGQNEFQEMIKVQPYRALRQRRTLFYEIKPLTMQESAAYIRHRLWVAGACENVFLPGAERMVFSFSKGYPRLINILCDRAMVTGYIHDHRTIDRNIINECAREVEYLIPRSSKTDRYRLPDTVSERRGTVPDVTLAEQKINDAEVIPLLEEDEAHSAHQRGTIPDTPKLGKPAGENEERAPNWQGSGSAGMAAIVAVFGLVADTKTVSCEQSKEKGTHLMVSREERSAGELKEADGSDDTATTHEGQVVWKQQKAPIAIPVVADENSNAAVSLQIGSASSPKENGTALTFRVGSNVEKVDSSLDDMSSKPGEKKVRNGKSKLKIQAKRPTARHRAFQALENGEYEKAVKIVTAEKSSSEKERRVYRSIHAKAFFGLAHRSFDSAPEKAVRLLQKAAVLAPDIRRCPFSTW